jgi:hypothetical protein
LNSAANYNPSQTGFEPGFNPYSFGSAVDSNMSMENAAFSSNHFNPSQYTSESPSLPLSSPAESEEPFFDSPETTTKFEESSDETPGPEPSSLTSTGPEATEPQPKRKRGRPRRDVSEVSYKPAIKASQRIPHNKVERKYRDGLNGQLEHLRLNVPTLPIFNPDSPIGPPKPGKMASKLAQLLVNIGQS